MIRDIHHWWQLSQHIKPQKPFHSTGPFIDINKAMVMAQFPAETATIRRFFGPVTKLWRKDHSKPAQGCQNPTQDSTKWSSFHGTRIRYGKPMVFRFTSYFNGLNGTISISTLYDLLQGNQPCCLVNTQNRDNRGRGTLGSGHVLLMYITSCVQLVNSQQLTTS